MVSSYILWNNVLPKPWTAYFDLIVGGSYWWSPANTIFLAFKIGIQQLNSSAYAHSSITHISNCVYFTRPVNYPKSAPVFVLNMTYESKTTSF